MSLVKNINDLSKGTAGYWFAAFYTVKYDDGYKTFNIAVNINYLGKLKPYIKNVEYIEKNTNRKRNLWRALIGKRRVALNRHENCIHIGCSFNIPYTEIRDVREDNLLLWMCTGNAKKDGERFDWGSGSTSVRGVYTNMEYYNKLSMIEFADYIHRYCD